MNRKTLLKISVPLIFLMVLGVVIYRYLTPEDDNTQPDVGDYNLVDDSLEGGVEMARSFRLKRAARRLTGRRKLTGPRLKSRSKSRREKFKGPPNSSKGASGIEHDIDDPYDDTLHDDKELLGTQRPCSKTGSCKKKREVREMLKKGVNSRLFQARKDLVMEDTNGTDRLDTTNKINGKEKDTGRPKRQTEQKREVLGSVNDNNSRDPMWHSEELETWDTRKTRDLEESDVEGNEFLDDLAMYKRNQKRRINRGKDDAGDNINDAITSEGDTEDAEVEESSKHRDLNNDILNKSIVDQETENRNTTENINKSKSRLRRMLNDVAYEEDIDDPNSGYGPWEVWSYCSVTCGLGRSDRRRICHNKNHCLSGDMEVKICLPQDC